MAQQRLQRMVQPAAREGLKQTPWDELRAQVVLGEEAFVRRVEQSARGDEQEQPSVRGLRRRVEFARVVKVIEEMKGERWQQFADRRGDGGRDLVLSLARQHCGLTLRELGKKAGMSRYSAVSKAIVRFQEQLQSDAKLRAMQHQANSVLSFVQV